MNLEGRVAYQAYRIGDEGTLPLLRLLDRLQFAIDDPTVGGVVVRLSGFLSVARIVAHTELLVIVPSILGEILATQEPVQRLELPFALPAYAVKQHWHARFHADAGNAWLWRTLAQLFGGG